MHRSKTTSYSYRRLGMALSFLAALALFACDRDKGEGEQPTAGSPGTSDNPPEPPEERKASPGQEGTPPARGAPPAGDPRGGAGTAGRPGAPAPGGEPGMGARPGQGDPEEAAIPEEQLDQFAEALGEVRDVREEYEPKITQAESTQEAQDLQKEAMKEIESRVSETGMSLAEYERIAGQVKARPSLQAKVEARLKELD